MSIFWLVMSGLAPVARTIRRQALTELRTLRWRPNFDQTRPMNRARDVPGPQQPGLQTDAHILLGPILRSNPLRAGTSRALFVGLTLLPGVSILLTSTAPRSHVLDDIISKL
jgi:hypothetical protein